MKILVALGAHLLSGIPKVTRVEVLNEILKILQS
jgi:hypothetical protein